MIQFERREDRTIERGPILLAVAPSAPAATAFACCVAIPAIHRSIATGLEWNGCWLSATRTNHRCSLCWSRTVAGSPLIVFLCHAARLTTLWGRVTTFLKERLIGSTEGKFLPAVAACNLHISGHRSPWWDCTAQSVNFDKDSFELRILGGTE